jgi:hypothetical protein
VPAGSVLQTSTAEGGVATAVWAPPQPTLVVATDIPDQYEYAVRVYDETDDRRLVAAGYSALRRPGMNPTGVSRYQMPRHPVGITLIQTTSIQRIGRALTSTNAANLKNLVSGGWRTRDSFGGGQRTITRARTARSSLT